MTTVLIPTRGRPDMLRRCLESLSGTWPSPPRTFIILDDDPDGEPVVKDFPHFNVLRNETNLAFWGSINHALRMLTSTEPFCYFGKDVLFDPYWLDEAERTFWSSFSLGMGLLTFKDDIHNGRNASHGMSTRRWLKAVYGEPFFPSSFIHFFGDSEFTARSSSLERFVYCPTSYVAHKHEQSGFDERKTLIAEKDKQTEHDRHLQWVATDKSAALQRMQFPERL